MASASGDLNNNSNSGNITENTIYIPATLAIAQKPAERQPADGADENENSSSTTMTRGEDDDEKDEDFRPEDSGEEYASTVVGRSKTFKMPKKVPNPNLYTRIGTGVPITQQQQERGGITIGEFLKTQITKREQVSALVTAGSSDAGSAGSSIQFIDDGGGSTALEMAAQVPVPQRNTRRTQRMRAQDVGLELTEREFATQMRISRELSNLRFENPGKQLMTAGRMNHPKKPATEAANPPPKEKKKRGRPKLQQQIVDEEKMVEEEEEKPTTVPINAKTEYAANRPRRTLRKRTVKDMNSGRAPPRFRHDQKGRLVIPETRELVDLCDCLDKDCPGCNYPCKKCGSRKCSYACRNNRRTVVESIEDLGGSRINNPFITV